MVRREIDAVFVKEGYRFYKGRPEEIGVYYKYHQEGFHVVMVVDAEHGYMITPEQHHMMEERIMGSFYHPQALLADFPDGFPVYHVEVLTLVVGGQSGQVRTLCAQCRNVWAYEPGSERLVIYENQPGDFFGLRRAFEVLQSGCGESRQKGTGYGRRSAVDTIKAFWRSGNGPYVTVGLLAINVIVYLVMELLGDTKDGLFVATYGGMYPTFLLYNHQWWRLFTAGFIHFGAAHLVNNMVVLYCMGTRLERMVGHVRFLIIYVVSLLGGSLLSCAVMLQTGDYAVSAGASGAVFGIIGGLLWVVMLHRGHLEDMTMGRIVFMILLTIYYGFSSSGIDNWGHIGGVLTGFLVTIILYHRKRQKY